MNSFLEKCCEECWHSKDRPCDLYIRCCTEGPLCHHNEDCKKKIKSLNKRLKYEEHDVPIIFIGMGTCGIASGAQKVKEAIEAELQKLNIDAYIIPTGCIGFCAKEVIVDVKLPGEDRVSYCEIIPKIIPQFIYTTLVEKKIYKENLLGTFGEATDELPSLKNHFFFKRQTKVVLENCGIINPDSIDSYIAAGGFKALDKVLRLMAPEEIVKEITNSGLRGRGGAGFQQGKNGSLLLKRSRILNI